MPMDLPPINQVAEVRTIQDLASGVGKMLGLAPEPEGELFMGTLFDERKGNPSFDTQITWKESDGEGFAVEHQTDPWQKDETHILDGTIISPRFARDLLQLSAAVHGVTAGPETDDAWGHVTRVQLHPREDLRLQAGSLQGSDGTKGAHIGLRLSTDTNTLALTIGHKGGNAHDLTLQGYFGVMPTPELYLGAGGDTNRRRISTMISWIDQGRPSAYLRGTADFSGADVYRAQLLLAERGTWGKGMADFFQRVDTGGEDAASIVGTGATDYCWPPFDANRSSRLSSVTDLLVTPELVEVGERVYWAFPKGFVGVGGTIRYDKAKEEVDGSIRLEIDYKLPIRLEAWTAIDVNALTGNTRAQAGLFTSF